MIANASLLATILVLAAPACFSPDYGAGGFPCSAEGSCPSAYECMEGVCLLPGASPNEPDASPGSIDANTTDANQEAPDADPIAPDADLAVPDATPPTPDAMPMTDAPTLVAPGNDLCGNAISLVDGDAVLGTLTDASDTSSIYNCSNGATPEVFYTFTIASNQHITLTLVSLFNSSLTLLASDCSTELTCLNDEDVGEILVQENLAAGTYIVAVEAATAATGDFSLKLDSAAAIVRPPNDQCLGATTLSDGLTLQDSMVLALHQADNNCKVVDTVDLAYAFTIPPGDNQRAVITVSNAIGFDPFLSIQAANCSSNTFLCTQDRGDDREILDATDLAPGDYVVWVEALGVTPTTFDLRLDLLPAEPAPEYDTCTSPDMLSEGVVFSGSTTGGANDLELSCVAEDGRDTVHEFTLAQERAVLVTVEPVGNWDLAASLRTKADCSLSSDLYCLADGNTSTRYFNQKSVAAGSYDVVVDGVDGDFGDYDISYSTRVPDTSFGYWPVTTTGVYTPLGASAVPFNVTGCDEGATAPIELTFEFPFYGVPKTEVTVFCNGYLDFAAAASLYTNDCPLDSSTPHDLIAVFWDDLKAHDDGSSTLKYEFQGVAPYRRFVVEWGNWNIFSPPSPQFRSTGSYVSHQAILYENGDIEFRYGPRTAPTSIEDCEQQHLGCSATIGLRNASGGDVDEAGCNSPTLVDEGTVYYFVHPL